MIFSVHFVAYEEMPSQSESGKLFSNVFLFDFGMGKILAIFHMSGMMLMIIAGVSSCVIYERPQEVPDV